MFKDMSADPYLAAAGISADWPHGRGCYISANRNFIIWVGEEDHLRIISMKNGLLLNELLDDLKLALDLVESLIEGGCAHSEKFGVIASCPSNAGTAMRASVHLQLPRLTAGGKVETGCRPSVRPLAFRFAALEESTPRLAVTEPSISRPLRGFASPKQKLCWPCTGGLHCCSKRNIPNYKGRLPHIN